MFLDYFMRLIFLSSIHSYLIQGRQNNKMEKIIFKRVIPKSSSRGKGIFINGKRIVARKKAEDFISKKALRRLARKGGIVRISPAAVEEARNALVVFCEKVVKKATYFAEHARRKTITLNDIVYALKNQGITYYF